FDAVNLFGYSLPSYPDQTQRDSSNLFNSLTGHDGVQFRPTTAAFEHAAHSADFQLSGEQPVVLSPAVDTVSPPEGARVAGSTSTRGEVAFDAKMDTANPSSVLSVTGCAATIEQPKWDTEGSRLTFMLRLPG